MDNKENGSLVCEVVSQKIDGEEKFLLQEKLDIFSPAIEEKEYLARVQVKLSVTHFLSKCDLVKKDGRQISQITYHVGGDIPCKLKDFDNTIDLFTKHNMKNLSKFDKMLGKIIFSMQKKLQEKGYIDD